MYERMRHFAECKNLPVIFLTACRMSLSMRTTLEEGPRTWAWLEKPCGLKVIQDKVQSALAVANDA